MAWRAIADTLPQSETLGRVSHLAERVFFRMLSQSDAWGRLQGSPPKLKAKCLPTLDVTMDELVEVLEELVQVGRILMYAQANGELACQLVEFDEHQPRALIGKRGSSRFEAPPQEAVADASRRMQNTRLGLAERARLGMPTHDRPRLVTPRHSQTETEKRVREEAGSTTAEAQVQGQLPISELAELAQTLTGADDHTPSVLAAVLHGQPEYVLARSIESLELRRADQKKPKLVSEAKYLVATIQRLREERAA